MISVKATREGLIGGKTASGYLVDRVVPFVALPSFKALHRFVRVVNQRNGKSTLAIVLDVGPWNERDDSYVFQTLTHPPPGFDPTQAGIGMGTRPAAESGFDTRKRKTNSAGIDLSEAVWTILDMKDNTNVSWEFVD